MNEKEIIRQMGVVIHNVKAGEEFEFAVPGTMQLLKGTAAEDLHANESIRVDRETGKFRAVKSVQVWQWKRSES